MHRNQGFTLVEVLVAITLSSIVLASLLVAYDIVEKQYTKIRDTTIMGQAGRNVLKIIERDVRMAGFAYRSDSGTLVHGEITDPIVINDSVHQHFDGVTVIYDDHNEEVSPPLTQRLRIRYWVESHAGTSGTRGRLFKQTDILAPADKIATGPQEAMADYIEDIQFESSGGNSNPNSLIEIYLALRTKKEFDREKAYQRQTYHPGDSTISSSDRYRRGEFSTSVAVRNLTL